ncbi:MAG: polysaccharide biosynthesis/export family protein, partial [Acidobacteria bacterium]|nr:polysaccharide biosynthesis/export family protein [Acidobacteriota bacterium]
MRLSAGPVLGCLLTVSSAWAQASEPVSSGAQRVEEYRIGIEDQLGVSVWGEPDLSMSVWVRPDGKITLPLVNDVQVVGMTPDDVRKEIARLLSTYVKDPNVTVIIEEINSFKVYFLGDGIA